MKIIGVLFFLVMSNIVSAQQTDIEKIIGTDDLVAVNASATNIPPRYRKIIDAFGIMSMGCTATHIGNGYVLTAGHCFWASEEPMINQDCADTTINWGVREGKEAYLKSTCEKIIIAQVDDVESNDYAIIKVSPVPSAFIPPDLERRAAIGDTLTMFSHPEELPLRWSPFCGVEKDSHPDLPQKAFFHQCDTNPGSSGATMLNILSLKVVGIHNGGLINENGSLNYGTKIMKSPIYETLKKLGF